VEEAAAEARCVIIVYKIEDALQVHRLNPSLLVSVNIQDPGAMDQYLASGFPDSCAVAFTGVRLADAGLFSALQQRGIRSILGTMGNLDQKALSRDTARVYTDLLQRGPDILSTDHPIVLGKVIRDNFPLGEEDEAFFVFPE
jgi:glycerophosphoryl diester phosphodiesterase